MKFLFVSNYINHHQIPFCNAMYDLLGEEFAFLQTEPMEEERIRMGWQQNVELPYLLKYYEEPERGKQLIAGSQVVLFGGVEDERYIAERLRRGAPVVRYSERLYREGQWKAISPRGLRRKYLDHTRYRRRNVYMLCSGAYVPSDFHIVGAYPDKLLRWGYFPETRSFEVERLFADKKPGKILWAARFLRLKHPELAIEAAKWLRDREYDFHMDIIGGGELEPDVRAWIQQYQLEEHVTLRGFLTPSKVREAMEEADIFLATSDRNEGWGAVLNEAMNSGCAVVADHMMGGVPFLIRHEENGLIYRDGDVEMFCRQVEKLVQNRGLCRKLGENAYRTITEQWNAQMAAKRLIALCVRLQFIQVEELRNATQWNAEQFDGKDDFPSQGPCSHAPVISERHMLEWLMRGKFSC
ncbi:MAG: glycosyltransferase family 4 protein [Lachnospiraceae bacterium]|nr:glycosyltransferase family 4 protein [Lachnospiraceae bacterium]